MPHVIGLAAMIGLGVPELLVIFAIIVVIFGASKLPQLGRGLGEGISNFKKCLRENDADALDEGGSGEDRPG